MATAFAPLQAPLYVEALNREALIEEHLSLVKYLASRFGSKLPPNVDVDDLVGAGTIGLIDAADKFNPDRNIRFRTYAENDSVGASGPIETLAAAADESPLSEYERVEKRDRLAAAIEALPEKERLVVSLYYVEELTMKEIGAVIGVNESRVSQIHSKAISRLRMALVCLAA
jgi:DNA-directed RNA polymerase specialized sigma subunit